MRSDERFFSATLVLVLATLSGCRPTEGSIALRFPNAQARDATVRILVEVYDPDVGLASVGDRTCAEFLGLAANAQSPMGSPESRPYECTPDADGRCPSGWFTDEPPFPIPAGRRLIYVLAYASREASATPILEGCTDRFDTGGSGDGSDAVPVDLQVVLPSTVRLVPAGLTKVVGLPSTTPVTPLRVRVEAEQPQLDNRTYAIPGVRVRFSPEGGVRMVGADTDGTVEVVTGRDGVAEARVTLPETAEVGFVTATSPAVRDAAIAPRRGSYRFVASAVEARSFRSTVARVEGIGWPVAVAVGALTPRGDPRAVITGCRGTVSDCDPAESTTTPGEGRLAVLEGLEGTPRVLPAGPFPDVVLPTDVVIARLRPDRERSQIAVLSARRAGCAERVCRDPSACPCWATQSGAPCPCEGAEVHLFEEVGGRVVAAGGLTLTASNAVALAPYRNPAQLTPRLAVAGRGRLLSERPCTSVPQCTRSDLAVCRTEPESCGCPAEEQCADGVCIASDKMIDMIAWAREEGRLENHLGCRVRDVFCNNAAPMAEENRCSCGSGTTCSTEGACRCRIPPRVWIGARDSNALPYDVASGRFGSTGADDLVAATDAGLVFIARDRDSFEYRTNPLVNRPVERLVVANLDAEAELDFGGPEVDDVAWFARSPCLEGVQFASLCPVVREDPDARACFGVYSSDGSDNLFRFETDCRRLELSETPIDLCSGDFDGNGAPDVAVSTVEGEAVLAFLGDGWGGLTFPPVELGLPPGVSGGPMSCADVDGDGITDIVMVDTDGNVTVLRSGS